MTDILSAMLTPVLAGFGLWIAYQQFRVAREKVKLELYEKRYRIFKATMALIASVGQNGGGAFNDALKFLGETSDAEFLFKKDVVDYLDTLYKRALDLTASTEQVKEGDSPNHEAAVKKKWDDVRWFVDQVAVARGKFRPYLAVNI